MKICVVGAGAIGTALAGRLHLAGHDVSILARGARRAFIEEHGLSFNEDGNKKNVCPNVIDVGSITDSNLVIAAVKSQSLPDLLPGLAAAMAPDALLMPAINGIPWWYFQEEACGRSIRLAD
jgi:2-dehydropantoate 2-reductase